MRLSLKNQPGKWSNQELTLACSPEYHYYKTDTMTIQLPPVVTWLLWNPEGFSEWYQKTFTSPSMILEITKNLPRSYLKCINHLIITSST